MSKNQIMAIEAFIKNEPFKKGLYECRMATGFAQVAVWAHSFVTKTADGSLVVWALDHKPAKTWDVINAVILQHFGGGIGGVTKTPQGWKLCGLDWDGRQAQLNPDGSWQYVTNPYDRN